MIFSKSRIRERYCLATVFFRDFPDFIIIGAQKAGTTSLYHYLAQHPDILTNIKEVHYFDNNYAEGKDWYSSHFPIKFRYWFRKNAIAGEATPYYLLHPHAPQRIKKLLPKVKLIAVLRNPTERAISHYFHEVRKGREDLPIMEALQQEDVRCRKEWEKLNKYPEFVSQQFQNYSYKARGIYIEQLERYYHYFPADQVYVLDSDDLFENPQTELQRIFAFLEIAENQTIDDIAPKNKNPDKKRVEHEVYDYLNDFYEPYNMMLYERLGRSFAW